MNRSGIASLAQQGRGGDSTLVHMRPDEVAAMQRMAKLHGTSMTINPRTGLPEAFKLKDVFNINTYTKPVRKAAEAVGLGGLSDAISSGFETLGKNAQYILPFIPGGAFTSTLGSFGKFAASPLGRGLMAGGIGALQGGRGSLRRGLLSGLTAYGLSSAYQGLQSVGGLGGPAPAPGPVDLTGAEGAIDPAAFERAMAPENIMLSDTGAGSAIAGPPATVGAGSIAPPVTTAPPSGFMDEVSAAGRGLKNIATGDKAAMKAFTDSAGKGAVVAGYTGITGLAALDEQEKLIDQAKAQQKISDAQYAEFKARIANARKRAEEAVRANPFKFNVGGEIDDQYQLMTPNLGGKGPSEKNVFGLAAGGMPRYLSGGGDGMSDSIPAKIGGVQEARLADGEFVVPADVVSHLGNGSSNAGAKQLYAMMDRVRQERTGTRRQGKEITPTKMMPA